LQIAMMLQDARRTAPLALVSLLVGFGIGALLTWPSARYTEQSVISMSAAPSAAVLGRRGIFASVIGSTVLGGQAQAATSLYKKKCDDNGGKCPPLFDELMKQTKENHAANVKADERLVSERSGQGRAAIQGNPQLAQTIRAKFDLTNKPVPQERFNGLPSQKRDSDFYPQYEKNGIFR